MFTKEGRRGIPIRVTAIAVLCVATSLVSSAMGAVAIPATGSIDGMAYGGSDCSDFMNGAAVGLGIGALFGCFWCAGGAIVAKGIALFC
jgi:hypothetical protein